MAINTKILSNSHGNSKREIILNLAEHHQEIFREEGVNNPKFIPRLAYKDAGETVIGFYEREIYGGKDIYIEFCSRDYTPEDPNRTLWKWEYKSDYKTRYRKSNPHPATGDRRYLIPTIELINLTKTEIKDEQETKETEESFELNIDQGAGSDVPYDAMTLRDYAAIEWKKPVSHKKWLNELITKTF